MAITNDVTIQSYNGSLLAANLLSGNAQTLVLNALGTRSDTTVTENNNQLVVGENVTLGDGRTATVIGSGTAQPGVNVLGATVPLGTPRDVVLLQSGEQTLFMYPAGSPNVVTAVAVVVTAGPTNYTFPGGIICFAAGTSILTDHGEVTVENLRVGDLVMTVDHGLQTLRWIGSTVLDDIELQVRSNLRPIRIKAGTLGQEMPTADLLVSPQHRILVRSKIAQKMFGADEVLVAAKQLLQVDGIDVCDSHDGVEYFHMLFDQHEVVFANGAQAESLYTGPEAIKTVGAAALEEIFEIFPELREKDYEPQGARTLLSGRMGRKLVSRHLQHKRPLVAAI